MESILSGWINSVVHDGLIIYNIDIFWENFWNKYKNNNYFWSGWWGLLKKWIHRMHKVFNSIKNPNKWFTMTFQSTIIYPVTAQLFNNYYATILLSYFIVFQEKSTHRKWNYKIYNLKTIDSSQSCLRKIIEAHNTHWLMIFDTNE